jgi:hypothetical protein
MISTDLDFLAFLKTLEGMDQSETIRVASRESAAAKNVKEKRGEKAYNAKLYEYISDIGTFLHFVRNSDNAGQTWPDAFLASSEWRNTQRSRYGSLLDDE